WLHTLLRRENRETPLGARRQVNVSHVAALHRREGVRGRRGRRGLDLRLQQREKALGQNRFGPRGRGQSDFRQRHTVHHDRNYLVRHSGEKMSATTSDPRGSKTRPAAWVLICVCAVALPRAARADDWPQWRGPDRGNISKETCLLKEWPEG